jgi:DNA-binding transcriptional LysR family regulator
MVRKIDWDGQVGRGLKLRDLHVFFTVVQRGSMAKAATQLGVSHPTVSEVIANLEHTFGVRLFDRSAHGVEPTAYGDALLKRSLAAFDELKQSRSDIQFLADPTSGQLRIGCAESLAAAILPPVIEQFLQLYPGVEVSVDSVVTGTPEIPKLRDRSLDLVLARMRPLTDLQYAVDLNVEILFDEKLVVAVGTLSPWARRRKVDLAELTKEPWILTEPDNWNHVMVAEAFRERGLDMPKIRLKTLSVHLRTNLLATGRFIAALPQSVMHLYAERFALKVLPVSMPSRPWSVAIVTLKNRTLSPVVERFIECTRKVAKSAALGSQAGKLRAGRLASLRRAKD